MILLRDPSISVEHIDFHSEKLSTLGTFHHSCVHRTRRGHYVRSSLESVIEFAKVSSRSRGNFTVLCLCRVERERFLCV